MPSPSYFPIIVGIALPLMMAGIIFTLAISVVGLLLFVLGIWGMALEPGTE